MTIQRDKMIERIRALKAKAADEAATEAEAMEAARMAAALLMRYDIEEDELVERDQTSVIDAGMDYKAKVLPEIMKWIAHPIQRLTQTKAYFRNRTVTHYIGQPADVEMALYLSEMLLGAYKRAWAGYVEEEFGGYIPAKQMMTERAGFIQGFGSRVADRLIELANQRDAASPVSNGTALVVVKDQLIKRFLKDEGYSFGRAMKFDGRQGSGMAQYAGMRAGDKVNLGRPMGGVKNSPRITS